MKSVLSGGRNTLLHLPFVSIRCLEMRSWTWIHHCGLRITPFSIMHGSHLWMKTFLFKYKSCYFWKQNMMLSLPSVSNRKPTIPFLFVEMDFTSELWLDKMFVALIYSALDPFHHYSNKHIFVNTIMTLSFRYMLDELYQVR